MLDIIIYTSESCPYCTQAKIYLDSKGYKYIEKKVDKDPSVRQEMIGMKMMGVPSFIIGDQKFSGFDKDKIESLIDYNVQKCPSCSQKMRLPKNKGMLLITCPKCSQKFKVRT